MDNNNLSKKIVLITGAGRGMGKSIAQAFVAEKATVIISDIDEKRVIATAKSIGAVGIKADVTNESDIESMVETIVARYGTIDILVNNAGVLRPTRIDDITKKEWDFVLNVNLNGTFLCSKAVINIMKKNGFGRIINMSSSAGRSVSTLGGAHYTAAKAGVLGFTRAIAKELAPYGITANAVCPGLIDTEMVRSDCSSEVIEAYENSFPIPRLGKPEEVAELVTFLASGASYITGASIDVNGGDLMI